jgi:hypothetical protein
VWISPEEWACRLRVAHIIAAALGSKATIVAPDQVGSQAVTLERLSAHADAVRGLRALGASIIVPIQLGPLAPACFDAAAARALGFNDFVRGIPGNKAAMPTRMLEQFVQATMPAKIHLLGVGPHNPRFRELVHAIRGASPQTAISCDSNLIAAHVGRSNGRGGEPRAVTAAENDEIEERGRRSRENAIVMAFGPAAMWRRAVLAGLLGDPARYQGVTIAPRPYGEPVVAVAFGKPRPPPPHQFDLFGDDS